MPTMPGSTLPDEDFWRHQETPMAPTFEEAWTLPPWARQWTIERLVAYRLTYGSTVEGLLAEASFNEQAQRMVRTACDKFHREHSEAVAA